MLVESGLVAETMTVMVAASKFSHSPVVFLALLV
jgi:hypothetical protein